MSTAKNNETLVAATMRAVAQYLDGQVAHCDGAVVGVVYYAAETREYLALDVTSCLYLLECVTSDDAETRRDAYSHWCGGTTGEGFGATAEDAAAEAGWYL